MNTHTVAAVTTETLILASLSQILVHLTTMEGQVADTCTLANLGRVMHQSAHRALDLLNEAETDFETADDKIAGRTQ